MIDFANDILRNYSFLTIPYRYYMSLNGLSLARLATHPHFMERRDG